MDNRQLRTGISYTATRLSLEEERAEIQNLSVEEQNRILTDIYGKRRQYPTQQQQLRQKAAELEGEKKGDEYNDVNDREILQDNDDDDDEEEEDCLTGRHETPEFLQRARRELEEAIEMIPEHEKRAYLEAVAHASTTTSSSSSHKVMETEADALRFLRFCNYNVWAAAQRIVRYWEFRRTHFGAERAFCPLRLYDIDGAAKEGEEDGNHLIVRDSALTVQDMELIKTGGIARLPSPECDDASGRAVIVFDFTRIPDRLLNRSGIVRLVFYIFSMATQDVRVQRKGVVLLFATVNNPKPEYFDRKLNKLCVELAEHCFPIRLRAMHMFVPRYINQTVADLVLPIIKKTFSKDQRRRFLVHPSATTSTTAAAAASTTASDNSTNNQNAAIRRTLEGVGLDPERLPPSVGGTWNGYDAAVEEFVRQQIKP
eukprot:scaffold278_cov195-Amphora_coffeaeformis.AAC.24